MRLITKVELDLGKFSVLDVRTPQEYREGHIEGALHIDIYRPDFRKQVSKLDKARKWLVYCRTDNRSRSAAQLMEQMGFDVTVLLGGYMEYQAA